MTPPLFPAASATLASLAAACLVGIAFGWALERAGLAQADKLAGQFYLTDFTVFKVMFSAILTAAIGAFALGELGLLDLSRVAVPRTYLLPQIAGGLIFGIGFVAAGLCPGTSCVAAASGRMDGVAVMAGMFASASLVGLALNPIARFAERDARGVVTLPEAMGFPPAVVLAGLTMAALAAFAGIEWYERRSRARGGARRQERPAGQRTFPISSQ